MKKWPTKRPANPASSILKLKNALGFLSPDQILMIDEMLYQVSPFGEVVLRVENGELKFVSQSKSYDAFKLQRPNDMEKELGDER